MYFALLRADTEDFTVIGGERKRSFVSLTWFEITNVIFLQTLCYFLQAVREMSYIYLYIFFASTPFLHVTDKYIS